MMLFIKMKTIITVYCLPDVLDNYELYICLFGN